MNEQFLESTEFYRNRYHNFASLLVIPVFILLAFVLLFAAFAKKELTLSRQASIEASRVLENIQSTSAQPILVNHLAENKEVKAGDLLIQYQSDGEQAQKENLSGQLQLLKQQKSQLELLKTSLETGVSQFQGGNTFGYDQTFQDYQAQAAGLHSANQQENANIASQNTAALDARAELGTVLDETSDKLADYRKLRSALETDQSLNPSSSVYNLYQTYSSQLTQATDTDKAALKRQFLQEIDEQIRQLEASLSSYRVQYAGSGSQQAYKTSLPSQLSSLKAQQLSKVGQDLTSLSQQIMETESKLKLQEEETAKGEIRAKQDGLLHLNSEVKGSHLVAEGTILAQVYPAITDEKKVKIVAYISSKDIASIKKGDKVRFMTKNDKQQQVTLSSRISSIASKATEREEGNVFKIECLTTVSAEQAGFLRYGLEGKFVVITGQKTYLNYWLDKILNKV